MISGIKVLKNYNPDQGDADLHWFFDPASPLPAGATFMVQSAETPDGPWSDALSTPTHNDYVIGAGPVNMTLLDCSWFRVIVFNQSGSAVYTSGPFSRMSTLNRHDWLIYREILRRERLKMVKYSGQRVWVFKVKTARGGKDEEYDPIVTSTIATTEHPDGYYSYGRPDSSFFDPVLTYADLPGTVLTSPNTNYGTAGLDQQKKIKGRFLAYPALKTEDVIHMPTTRSKWEIEDVDPVTFGAGDAEIIAQNVTMSMLVPSDPRHKLQINPEDE